MIGVIGGYGKVGSFSCKYLKENSCEKLRIGGRDTSHAPLEFKTEFPNAEWQSVDATDSKNLEAFFDGCACILDAATLSEDSSRRMDSIAQEARIPLVHLGLSGFQKSPSRIPILYGAGSIPGLSGLLPQYLAKQFDRVRTLHFFYGGVGTFSQTAAKDYLDGIFEDSNHSMVYWKDGKTIASPPQDDVPAEWKSRFSPCKAFPYFDAESRSVAEKLHLSEGHWQMCICGERTLKVLESARFHYRQNPGKTLEDLLIANRLDTFGVNGNAAFLCQMEGEIRGETLSKTLNLSGISSEALTGKVAAIAAMELLSHPHLEERLLLGESPFADVIVERLLDTESSLKCQIQTDSESLAEGEI